jgi:hypothetical protein
MFLKVRKTNNSILDFQKTEFINLPSDMYQVEVSDGFSMRQSMPSFIFKWDSALGIIKNDEAIIKEEYARMQSNILLYKYTLNSDIYHRDFDFTTILYKDEAIVHLGQKIKQEYFSIDGELVVSKEYIYNYGNRNIYGNISSNRLLSLTVKINWFDYDGNIADTKEVLVKKYNRQEEGEALLKKRDRQIAALKSLAYGTAAEPVVDVIYSDYDTEIFSYIHRNSPDFKNAIYNESDTTIIEYLNIDIPQIFTDEDLSNMTWDGSNWIYKIKWGYTNCMLDHYTNAGDELEVWSENNPDYTKDDAGSKCIYAGLSDGYYIFKFDKDSSYDWSATLMNIKFTSKIKEYILHEIE